jgi:hypothetical protein
MAERSAHFEAMRGIAALVVVADHTVRTFDSNGGSAVGSLHFVDNGGRTFREIPPRH